MTAYDLVTASYVREVSKGSVDSNQTDLKKNSDGSVDVYFGPKAPKGKEANWIPTLTSVRRQNLLDGRVLDLRQGLGNLGYVSEEQATGQGLR